MWLSQIAKYISIYIYPQLFRNSVFDHIGNNSKIFEKHNLITTLVLYCCSGFSTFCNGVVVTDGKWSVLCCRYFKNIPISLDHNYKCFLNVFVPELSGCLKISGVGWLVSLLCKIALKFGRKYFGLGSRLRGRKIFDQGLTDSFVQSYLWYTYFFDGHLCFCSAFFISALLILLKIFSITISICFFPLAFQKKENNSYIYYKLPV